MGGAGIKGRGFRVTEWVGAGIKGRGLIPVLDPIPFKGPLSAVVIDLYGRLGTSISFPIGPCTTFHGSP